MACGHILVTHSNGFRKMVALPFGQVRIGSALDNDLVLHGVGIAPYHATVRYDEADELLLRLTLGDSAGQMEVEIPRSFAPAMMLRVGEYVLSYKPETRHSTRPIAANHEPLHERSVGGEALLLQALLEYPEEGSPDAETMELPALSTLLPLES